MGWPMASGGRSSTQGRDMSEKLPPAVLDIVHNERNILRAFLRLEEFYRMADPEQRAAIREGWPFGRRWSVPGLDYSDIDRIVFAPLIGEDADGLDAQARIEARLTYHAIENARSDFRDNTYDIVLCYHSALSADLDVFQVFEEAAAISEERIAGIMLHFLRGQPENRSLWVYGFHEELIENGIAFQWIGADDDFDARKPKRLDSMGREVKD